MKQDFLIRSSYYLVFGFLFSLTTWAGPSPVPSGKTKVKASAPTASSSSKPSPSASSSPSGSPTSTPTPSGSPTPCSECIPTQYDENNTVISGDIVLECRSQNGGPCEARWKDCASCPNSGGTSPVPSGSTLPKTGKWNSFTEWTVVNPPPSWCGGCPVPSPSASPPASPSPSPCCEGCTAGTTRTITLPDGSCVRVGCAWNLSCQKFCWEGPLLGDPC